MEKPQPVMTQMSAGRAELIVTPGFGSNMNLLAGSFCLRLRVLYSLKQWFGNQSKGWRVAGFPEGFNAQDAFWTIFRHKWPCLVDISDIAGASF